MSSVPLVSVLTAVRNGARYLGETIASIQAQTFTDWEYLIVDDASDDNTVEVVMEATRKDSRIRLLRRPDSGGPYVAANDGLREARGKYIVRTDGDDLQPPYRIERQLDYLGTHREYRSCVSFWQYCNGQGLIPNSAVQIPCSPRVFQWSLLLRAPSMHSALCVERSAMEAIGGYKALPLSQDYRLWCELTQRGWLGTIPEVLSYVRVHEHRVTRTRSLLQRTLALDVLTDHLAAIAGQAWTRQDIEALWSVGRSESMPLNKGLEILDRWERLWRGAAELTPEDRTQLSRIGAACRWKHLRGNVRRQPVPAAWNFLKLTATRPNSLLAALHAGAGA